MNRKYAVETAGKDVRLNDEATTAGESPTWHAVECLRREIGNLEDRLSTLPERLQTLLVPQPSVPQPALNSNKTEPVLAELPQAIRVAAARIEAMNEKLIDLMRNMQL